MTVYLTKELIEVILRRVLRETSEDGPEERARILHPNLLDLILDLPSQSLYGTELHPTI